MTWLWFTLIGLFALLRRKSISKWIENWSDDVLKQWAAGGLIAFGVMATFGLALGTNLQWLHIAAGVGGVLGFFAVHEIANRRASGRQYKYMQLERLQDRMSELREQHARSAHAVEGGGESNKDESPRRVGRRIPPLIKPGDSEQSILDLLSAAAEEWENPERQIDLTAAAKDPANHQTYQSVVQILKRASEDKERTRPKFSPESAGDRLGETAASATKTFEDRRETHVADERDLDVKPLIKGEETEHQVCETHAERIQSPETFPVTPEHKSAPTASVSSPMARESGPISLSRAVSGGPEGPLSRLAAQAGPSSRQQRPADKAFVYQPLMVKSRLGGVQSTREAAAPDEEPKTPEDQPPESESSGGEQAADA